MSTLWIREYATIPGSARAARDISSEPGTDQTVTYTTTTQSNAFAATTSYVTISSDAAFHYVVGTNPTATTGALRIALGVTHSFAVTPGQKLAVVAAA